MDAEKLSALRQAKGFDICPQAGPSLCERVLELARDPCLLRIGLGVLASQADGSTQRVAGPHVGELLGEPLVVHLGVLADDPDDQSLAAVDSFQAHPGVLQTNHASHELGPRES